MDPFAAPRVTDRQHSDVDLSGFADPHLLVVFGFLVLTATQYLSISPLFPVAGVFGGLTDPDLRHVPMGWAVGAFGGGLVGTVLFGIGLLQAVAAVGVWLRTRWGWAMGLLALALNGMLCLGPVAIYGGWVLLREEGRQAFGVDI